MEIWKQLSEKIQEIYSLRSANALLGWDQETKMPPGGGEGRAMAMASLSKIIQEKYVDRQMGDLLEAALDVSDTNPAQKAIIREIKRDRDRYLKIPAKLTEQMAKTSSLCQQNWAKARQTNDSASYNPWLSKMLDLCKEQAKCIGYTESPYDPMLDIYEPDMKTSEIRPVFSELKTAISSLLEKLEASKIQFPALPENGYSIDAQKLLNRALAEQLGFSLSSGRLDESAHPFTEGIWPGDVRLTTRYNEREILGALFGTIHEVGHGLYEQGFSPEYYGTPLAEAVSLGIHESQSRLWENQVGRSLSFWKYFYPELQKTFPNHFGSLKLNDFYKAINKVEKSFIRVDADELTYNLHIILRFELELELFSGNLQVENLEEAWKEKSKELLGIVPEEPRLGYMQDVHWSVGLFGYFPTYALGNIYSAQLFEKAKEQIPQLDELIEKGEFFHLREWLRKNIHQYGRQYQAAELMENACGEKISTGAFLNYLENKYGNF